MNSSAWIMISVAVPAMPARGWWIMILRALNPSLERHFRDRLQAQVDDSVREELLLQGRRGRLERRLFRDEEARDPEVPEPLEPPKGLGPAVRELEDQLERVPRVDREETEVPLFAEFEDFPLQDGQEGFAGGRGLRGQRADFGDHLLQVLTAATQVEDRERVGDRRRLEAERGDVLEEAARALFQSDVQARRPFERVMVQHVVRQGRLHRTARPADEDDVTLRDAASEDVFVEAPDMRLHEGPRHRLPLTSSSPG